MLTGSAKRSLVNFWDKAVLAFQGNEVALHSSKAATHDNGLIL